MYSRRRSSPVIIPPSLVATIAAVDAHPQPELGADVEEIAVDGVFLDDMRVAANAARVVRRTDERAPGPSEVRGFVRMRRHIAGHVAIERRVRFAVGIASRFHPRDDRR